MEEHRIRLANRHPEKTLLIQLPQSSVFPSESFKAGFRESLGTRIAARDQHSYTLIESEVKNVMLCPDAVHVLGHIPSGT